MGNQGYIKNGMNVEESNTPPVTKNTDKEIWFAMRAPFCRELEAARLLKNRGVENFVPMSYKVVMKRNGTKSREFVPSIHNLIFVRTSLSVMKSLKKDIPVLQYYVRRENGKNIPIIVPDEDMVQFMSVTKLQNEKLIFFKPDEIDLRKGTRVRIVGGLFDGIKGVFVKVRGVRNKRVVIRIGEIATAAVAEISPDLIEVLPD